MAEIKIEHTVKQIRESLALTIKYHKMLWMWLYDNPSEGKHDWPPFWDDILDPSGDCFFCEYAINEIGKHPEASTEDAKTCKYCPAVKEILWIYDNWCVSENINERKDLASQILTIKLKPWAEELMSGQA